MSEDRLRQLFKRVSSKLEVGEYYSRRNLDEVFETGETFSRSREGLVPFGSLNIALFCTLDKSNKPPGFSYHDFFEGTRFHWDSQNNQHIKTPTIQNMVASRWQILLFCRVREKIRSKTQPFVYCGRLAYSTHDADTSRPVHIIFDALDYQINPNLPLKRIYQWTPNTDDQFEARPTERAIEQRNVRSGRYQADAQKRKLVEMHAMRVATTYYEEKGFEVTDVSATHSYDLICTSDTEDRLVEVKGLQGGPSTVQLTANEVMNARDSETTTDLFVVHGIRFLNDKETQPDSGLVIRYEDWEPDDIDLVATQFTYRLLTR